MARGGALAAGGVEREGSLAALQVRHAHPGEQNAREFLRGKSDGHADHGGEDARLAEVVPEGPSLAQQFQLGTAERKRVGAQPQVPARAADLGGGKIREVAARVAGQEIVDVVLAGIDPGEKRRPGDRGDRRKSRLQRPESAGVAEPGQVGHLAFVHELCGQLRVHAVKADDDDALHPRPAVGLPPADGAVGLGRGPSQEREQTRKKSQKQSQERAEKGEAGAGPGVGCGRRRQEQDQDHQQDGFPGSGHRNQTSVRSTPFRANPDTSETTKNTTSQSGLKGPRPKRRRRWLTSTLASGASSGRGGSPGGGRNSCKKPARPGAGDTRAGRVATVICLGKLVPATLTCTMKNPALSALSCQTASFSAGRRTGGAVSTSPSGKTSET